MVQRTWRARSAPVNAARKDAAWTSQHSLDLRGSVPLPGGQWYVRIIAGPERRSQQRLEQEGQTRLLLRLVIYAVVVGLPFWLVACAAIAAHLLKSALQHDFFDF